MFGYALSGQYSSKSQLNMDFKAAKQSSGRAHLPHLLAEGGLWVQYLWSRKSMASEAAISLGIAGAAAAALTGMWTLRLLALAAIGEIVIQQLCQQHEHQQGLKII